MSALPDKLSDLIRVALRDLRSVEQDPRYIVDMAFWHKPDFIDGRCLVCLAGAVMSRTLAFALGESPELALKPFDGNLDYATSRKMLALDELRGGNVYGACGYVDIEWINELEAALGNTFPVTPYESDPEDFHRDMQALADKLESLGL